MSSFIFIFKNMGLLGLVALMIFLDNGVFHNLNFYGKNPYDFIGQLDELQNSFEQAQPDRITTAVFGDSQGIDAVRPDLMGEAVGRAPSTIFNFSITGGKAYDIYHTYLAYEKKLPALKEAILVVNEHQINSFEMYKDTKFRYYAGLQDRVRVMDKDNYGELMLGWVSKAFDLRTTWAPLIDKYRKGTLPKPYTAVPGGIHAKTDYPTDGLSRKYAENTADRWFKGYDVNGLQTDSLEALLKNLHDRGVRVIILQIPRSSVFEEAVRDKYPKEQQLFVDIVSHLAKKYDAEFEIMSNKGLTEKTYFRDSNHLNPKGAAIVSKEIAERWLTDAEYK